MTTAIRGASAKTQIRAILEDQASGAREKDIDRIMEPYADDVVAFEFGPPLRRVGKEALRKECEDGYAALTGEVNYDVKDEVITAKGDLAFVHCLEHVTGTLKDGTPLDIWSRSTRCFQKLGGNWKIVHQHLSHAVEGDKARLDLKP